MEVFASVIFLNIHHRGQNGQRASSCLITTAYFLAKLTFSQLDDPTGKLAGVISNNDDDVNKSGNVVEHHGERDWRAEYKSIASVFDRFFLVFFIVSTVAAPAGIVGWHK
jgi:hypothetical protein